MYCHDTKATTSLRSADALALLDKVAQSGAACGPQAGVHIEAGVLEPGMQELISRGYVTPMDLMTRNDHNHYTMTPKGQKCVAQCVELTRCGKLMEYKRSISTSHQKLESCTRFELIMMLHENGWTDEHQPKSRKIPPFTGNNKTWYIQPGHTLSKLYLRALLEAPKMLKDNIIQRLFHFQGQAYYQAVLDGLNPLPDQPLQYYKLLSKRCNQKDHGQVPEKDKPRVDEFDEVGFLTILIDSQQC